jgi:hypothetical protein
MRQVMPHRNNIVARCRGCKTFLRRLGSSPLNSGGLLHFGLSRCRRRIVKKISFINDL